MFFAAPGLQRARLPCPSRLVYLKTVYLLTAFILSPLCPQIWPFSESVWFWSRMDLQHCVTSQHTTQWFDISVQFRMITTISPVTKCHPPRILPSFDGIPPSHPARILPSFDGIPHSHPPRILPSFDGIPPSHPPGILPSFDGIPPSLRFTPVTRLFCNCKFGLLVSITYFSPLPTNLPVATTCLFCDYFFLVSSFVLFFRLHV